MAYSEAQNRATQYYVKTHYDNINVRVPKGKRDQYKKMAEEQGKSLNRLIVELLENEMQK